MMEAPGWCCEATDVVTMQQKLKSASENRGKMLELVKKEAQEQECDYAEK